MFRISHNAAIFIASLAMASLPVCTGADDLKLKDGTKISGSIVGFDDSSFKVLTSFGYALVRKDQVVSISIADPSKNTEKKPDAAPPIAATGADQKKPDAAVSEKTAKTDNSSPVAPSPKSDKITAAITAKAIKTDNAPASTAATKAETAPTTSQPATAANPSTAVAPSPQPAPAEAAKIEPVREQVDGNTYTNETYGFRMYKPPTWEVIAGAQTLMPGAITAMGTIDETTYLLIGEGPAGKTMKGDIDATERRLHGMVENFRSQGETQVTVSGTAAVERHFRGTVDDKDWSGTVAYVTHGGQLYTIFGMTLADTDLVQIQENVIHRAISSLQFSK